MEQQWYVKNQLSLIHKRFSTWINILYVGSPHISRNEPIHTGLTPIAIKIQETSQLYQLTKGNRGEEVLFDRDMGVKYWQHPAETTTFLMDSNESASLTQNIYRWEQV